MLFQDLSLILPLPKKLKIKSFDWIRADRPIFIVSFCFTSTDQILQIMRETFGERFKRYERCFYTCTIQYTIKLYFIHRYNKICL